MKEKKNTPIPRCPFGGGPQKAKPGCKLIARAFPYPYGPEVMFCFWETNLPISHFWIPELVGEGFPKSLMQAICLKKVTTMNLWVLTQNEENGVWPRNSCHLPRLMFLRKGVVLKGNSW